MFYEEFRRQVRKAGLVNREFAELIAVHEKTVSNMAQKKSVPNHMATMAVLMALLADNSIPFKDELKALQLKKAEPRGKSFNKKENTKD